MSLRSHRADDSEHSRPIALSKNDRGSFEFPVNYFLKLVPEQAFRARGRIEAGAEVISVPLKNLHARPDLQVELSSATHSKDELAKVALAT